MNGYLDGMSNKLILYCKTRLSRAFKFISEAVLKVGYLGNSSHESTPINTKF